MTSYLSTPLNRGQRRLIERTEPAAERIVDADARFFERFPRRQHRLRPMSATELEQLEIAKAAHVPGPGERWGVAVKQVMPGGRIRRGFTCRRSFDLLDQPEDVAAATFAQLANADPLTVIVEAEIRRLMQQKANQR